MFAGNIPISVSPLFTFSLHLLLSAETREQGGVVGNVVFGVSLHSCQ